MPKCSVAPLLFFMLFCFASCEVKMPENVIPPEKMEAFLYDYHLVQSMSGEYAANDFKEKLFYDYIFKKHGIDRERFDSSLVWYNRYPKHLKKIYSNLEKRLEQEMELLGDAKGAADGGVTIEMAYLATDTAELWTASQLKLLSATPLNSKILFAFDVPRDTTFLQGDSLCFSFDAHFISGGVEGLKQQAFASVLLEYDNGNESHNSVMVNTTGSYTLPLPRNFETRPKRMCGFVHYSDNDTSVHAKLLLSNISLKRVHPAVTGEESDKKGK